VSASLPSSDLRKIAFLFGLVSAVLLIVAGTIDFIGGFIFLALGSGSHALRAWADWVLLVVVGVVIGLFAAIGRGPGNDRAMASGVVLIVVAIVGWLGLGLGNGVLALLGALFCLIAGILFLVSIRG